MICKISVLAVLLAIFLINCDKYSLSQNWSIQSSHLPSSWQNPWILSPRAQRLPRQSHLTYIYLSIKPYNWFYHVSLQITNIYQYVWRVVNGNACWYIWCYWWTQTGKPSTHPGLCSQLPRPLYHRPPLLKCSPGMKRLERQAKETQTCDPPLKARNPKTRMKPPSPARGTEWPGISTGFPSMNLQMVMVMVTEWPLAIDVHCPSGDKDIEVDRWPLVRWMRWMTCQKDQFGWKLGNLPILGPMKKQPMREHPPASKWTTPSKFMQKVGGQQQL